MGGQRKQIAVSLLAAVRDGDLTQAEAARQANISRQVFARRFIKFRAEQAQQRSRAALAACEGFKRQCHELGFSKSEVDELERLWWAWHDEEGNFLKSPRQWYRRPKSS